MVDPPATAGGTDSIQVRFLTFEAKHVQPFRVQPLGLLLWDEQANA